jgi:hypothetical protein
VAERAASGFSAVCPIGLKGLNKSAQGKATRRTPHSAALGYRLNLEIAGKMINVLAPLSPERSSSFWHVT